eukprot:2973384-Rhodomonas_salina.1
MKKVKTFESREGHSQATSHSTVSSARLWPVPISIPNHSPLLLVLASGSAGLNRLQVVGGHSPPTPRKSEGITLRLLLTPIESEPLPQSLFYPGRGRGGHLPSLQHEKIKQREAWSSQRPASSD